MSGRWRRARWSMGKGFGVSEPGDKAASTVLVQWVGRQCPSSVLPVMVCAGQGDSELWPQERLSCSFNF